MGKLMYFNIFDLSKEKLISILEENINSNKKTIIISGNPEILNFYTNYPYKNLDNTIIIPDGIGVVILHNLFNKNKVHKIAGVDLFGDLLKLSSKNNYNVFMLGAKKNILHKAIENIHKKYNINIVGYLDGYFKSKDEYKIIDFINSKNTDILFVGMGCPKQEIFIQKYKDDLNCKLIMGVGGSFDIYSGEVKRAPKIMIKLGLEWLYRIITQPYRITKLINIPIFIFKVLKFKMRKQ